MLTACIGSHVSNRCDSSAPVPGHVRFSASGGSMHGCRCSRQPGVSNCSHPRQHVLQLQLSVPAASAFGAGQLKKKISSTTKRVEFSNKPSTFNCFCSPHNDATNIPRVQYSKAATPRALPKAGVRTNRKPSPSGFTEPRSPWIQKAFCQPISTIWMTQAFELALRVLSGLSASIQIDQRALQALRIVSL